MLHERDVIQGEELLALTMFRKMSPVNQAAFLELAESMRRSQVEAADSQDSDPAKPQ